MKIQTRFATFADHENILKVAKQSPYTRDFSNHIFSGEAMYQKEWIKVAVDDAGIINGFYCVRHKIRQPATTLYFLGVDAAQRGRGIGEQLLLELASDSPHRCIQLNVMKDNQRAINFYLRNGCSVEGEAMNGKAVKMELRW